MLGGPSAAAILLKSASYTLKSFRLGCSDGLQQQQGGSLAGFVTALAGFVTALAGFVTALAVLLQQMS